MAALRTLKSPHSDAPPLTLTEGNLQGRVQPVSSLTHEERDGMFALLEQYFEHVTRARFEADLQEKELVILLTDTVSGAIKGFSTLMRMETEVAGRSIVAFFSGDTIVAREYWGETLLPRLWARTVFGLAETLGDAEVYWFLISSGYKTYRFLPVFFQEFYPTYAASTPPDTQAILETLAAQKFTHEYDASAGVVRFAHATPLRAEVAEPDERRLRDPHVAFFLSANPTHAQGDELACITRVLRSNLTPAGRRMLGL